MVYKILQTWFSQAVSYTTHSISSITPMVGERSPQSVELFSFSVYNNISVLWNLNLFSRLDLLSGTTRLSFNLQRTLEVIKPNLGLIESSNLTLWLRIILFIEHTVEAFREVSEKYEPVGQCIGYCRSFGPLKYLALYLGFFGPF